MLSDESKNIFQSVLAKQSCSLASASLDHFEIERVNGISCLLLSMKPEDRVMVQFAKRGVGESFVCVSVCGAKMI
jgi:hypothetical protein